MRRLAVAAALLLLIISFVPAAAGRDFASEVKLNMNSETLKQEVTVHAFVDGDTTHFNVPVSVSPSGVLKARYLGLNTPESTGKIEEYGKKAASFTREKLENASSIIIESDDPNWNVDSSGGRVLVWVWYRTGNSGQYRNLNIELLQNGLANAYSTASNRYGATAMAALNYAKENKLNLFSGQKDPDYYYGDAVELTLRELRCNVAEYDGIKVAFEGVITMNDGGSIYVEDYDADTDRYYGISVYYGHGLPGKALEILSVGNRSRIVGTVQYYENGGIYQVSGLTYRQMKPKDPGNVQLISSGHSGAFVPTDAWLFANGRVEVESQVYDYAYLSLDTTVSMSGLKVVSAESTDDGVNLICRSGGAEVAVRVGYREDSRTFKGKTVDIRGIVALHDGGYEIKVLSQKDITII